MQELLEHLQQIINLPTLLVNQIPLIPEFIKQALLECIYFVPILYFLYYAIELLERYFLKHINIFIKLMQKLGPIFGAGISTIPESGYQVIASTFYSRKMMTRGTLLSFFIVCSDDALPLLFLDISKCWVIIPILVIKIITALVVAYSVDIFQTIFRTKKELIENINAINYDLNEPACCNHRIVTQQNPPYWWKHPFVHTFNIFIFMFITLSVMYWIVQNVGSYENLASILLINTPYQIILTALIGLISNSVVSIVFALAYVKGLISFPALLSGLITVTGLGLATLKRRSENKQEVTIISTILFIVAVIVGLYVHAQIIVGQAMHWLFAG